MNTFSKLSKDGLEIALSSVAFIAGRSAAAKALGTINRELKANIDANRSIDNVNDELADNDADRQRNEHTEEIGYEAPVSFEDYCTLLAYTNDEIEVLANGGTWPRTQSVAGIVDWLCKATPQRATPSRLAAFKALIKAHSGSDLADADARVLFDQDAQSKAEFFAGAYTEHRDEIIERIHAAMSDATGMSSFDTVFDNLPRNVKANLLSSVDYKLNDKADELLTGKKRSGEASPVARIPLFVRAGTIALIRDDQKKVSEHLTRLADAVAA